METEASGYETMERGEVSDDAERRDHRLLRALLGVWRDHLRAGRGKAHGVLVVQVPRQAK